MHGGSAPQVRAKAEERIKALAEGPALARIAVLIDKGESDTVRLAAARDILDRAGYGARQRIDVYQHVQAEAQRIATELGIPVEQVLRESGVSATN